MTQHRREPNRFDITGSGVQITYEPIHFIDRPNLPQLTYQDSERNLTFHKGEIRTQHSELGTLVSVSLERTVDAGDSVLTLLLPSINLAGASEQNFDTLAIITRSFGILPHTGAGLDYTVLSNLQGVARIEPIL